jgi:antitoxin component YwqK of YwqJK toxin-antitoxin module
VYQNGKLAKKNIYKDGVLDGVSETYYPSGELLQQALYEKGSSVGEEKKFYQNGTVMQMTQFKDGKPVLMQQFDQKGKLLKEKEFNT